MSRRIGVIVLVCVVLVVVGGVVFYLYQHQQHGGVASQLPPPVATPVPSGPPPIGMRTKTSGCTVNGALQDPACTPGAVMAGVTTAQICRPGYAHAVRNVPSSEKDQVYAEYGIASHQPGQYEVDHLISLELGGSNELANLWPEAANPRPGFHQKDEVENYLHAQVCSGAFSLEQAQRMIASNWMMVYTQLHNGALPAAPDNQPDPAHGKRRHQHANP